jgi:hypothetical protein
MAWRIHDNVTSGEIDNRTKGIVRGRIWIHGIKKPVKLELKGNACPDLAGCFLKFRNPGKTFSLPTDGRLHQVQEGTIGDLTASRKVRVPDVSIEEFVNWPKGKTKPPEHMGNCLYLEWFSEANGRVVIEGVDWELEISAPEWRLTPEENKQRAEAASSGMSSFMQRLSEAIEKQQRDQKDPEEQWDEHDYERFLRECDARGDKYRELLEKYGDSEEGEAIIEKEMGWSHEDQTEEEAEAERLRIEEMNRIAEEALNEPPPEPDLDPAREGIDWIRTEDGDICHPLQHRCFESSIKFHKLAKAHGLEEEENESLRDFVFEFQTTGGKLAGALDGIAEGNDFCDAAFTVAYLKRALGHLHKAQAALEVIAPRKILPANVISEARQELFEIREGILRLMDDFRGRE